jgi:hypothetical protein
METDTLIVCSCDQNYFPLVKGLLLSILDSGPLSSGLGLAFIDIGCDLAAVRWLRDRGARVCVPDPRILGGLADAALGYRRSQTCSWIKAGRASISASRSLTQLLLCSRPCASSSSDQRSW